MTILRLDFVATLRQGSMSIPSTDCECWRGRGRARTRRYARRAVLQAAHRSGDRTGRSARLWAAHPPIDTRFCRNEYLINAHTYA